MRLKEKTKKRMFENIYDLIKGGEFEKEARKELNSFLRGKQISWDGITGVIKIGRDFIIKIGE